MTQAQPVLLDFGDVAIVSPNGWPTLTGRQWSDIEAAMILAANDRRDGAAHVILDLEERMGVRPAHRYALATSPGDLAREIGRTNRSRQKAERERVRQLQAPWKPPVPDAKLIAHAERKLASHDPRQKAAGTVALLRIEALTNGRAEALRTQAEQAEIKQLAQARGDVIEVEASDARGHKGRLRITNRDGLETLFLSGSLSPMQYAAGMRYRDLYERVDPEKALKPMDYEGVYSPNHGGDGFAAKRSGWMREIQNVEAIVRNHDKNGLAVRALQEVAGHRRCIATFVSGGHARKRHTDGLIIALDVCAGVFGLK